MHNRYTLELLPPRALEKLARDLIQEREKKMYKQTVYFRTFKEGKDGGIDFKAADQNFFGQVRKCNTRFSAFFNKLKSELPKVQKLNPERYFIVTNLPLGQNDIIKIKDYFNPYIKYERDILGFDSLIELLNHYDHIAELYFPSDPAKAIVQKESYEEYVKASNEKDFFYKHKSFYKALKKLQKSPILVIGGAPGIGKTILARALSYHYIENLEYDDFYFIRGEPKNALVIHKRSRKQVFFMDDILGDAIASDIDSYLLRFIEHIKNDKDTKLIITSRNYVLEKAVREFDRPNLARFQQAIPFLTNNVVNIEAYSQVEKEHILFNQIKFSQLPFPVVEHIAKEDSFNIIGNSANFSPRILEEFIQSIEKKKISGSDFENKLLRYFDNPYEYWLKIFNDQPQSYKYALLIMLISNAPMLHEDLLRSFIKMRKQINFCEKGYEAVELDKALFDLNDLFVKTATINGIIIIEFKNPSIKDFLLSYLHKNPIPHIEHLIKGAAFYNQLFFAFSTSKNEEIYDEKENEEIWDESPMLGNKVELDSNQKKILLNKALKKFDKLKHSELRQRNTGDEKIFEKRKGQNILAWKLLQLLYNFEADTNPIVVDFVKSKIRDINFWNDSSIGYIGEQNMVHLPRLIEKFLPYYPVDAHIIIKTYFSHIESTNELYEFERFKDLFPNEYTLFLTNNQEYIYSKIIKVFNDTVYLYTTDPLGKYNVDAALFIDQDIDVITEMYGVELESKYENAIRKKINILLQQADETSLQKQAIKIENHNKEEDNLFEEPDYPQYDLLLPPAKPDLLISEAIKYFQEHSAIKPGRFLEYIENNLPLFQPFFTSYHSIETLVRCWKTFGISASLDSKKNTYLYYTEYIFQQFSQVNEIPFNNELITPLVFSLCTLSQEEKYFKISVIEDLLNSYYELTDQAPNNNLINCTIESDILFERSEEWYSYKFPFQLPYLKSLYISWLQNNSKEETYNYFIPRVFYGNLNVPAFWEFSNLMDNVYFTEQVLLKQLKTFIDHIENQYQASNLFSIIKYLDIHIYFRRLQDSEKHSFDIWKIVTSKAELLFVFDFLGAKIDFQLLNKWFLDAFKSTKKMRDIHNKIVRHIKNFADEDSSTPDPSPLDHRYTSYRLVSLYDCVQNDTFLSVIKSTLFADQAANLHGFVNAQIEKLEKQLTQYRNS
jgi:conflict system STAND superfamily ATPase